MEKVTKKCCRCKTTKPLEDFAKSNFNSDKLQKVCRACKKIEAIKWREKSPLYQKEWREANPNYFKDYYSSRKEHFANYQREKNLKKKL